MKIETDIITNEYGSLKSVTLFYDVFEDGSSMNAAIKMSFEQDDIYHEAIRDTDEISSSSKLKNKYKKQKIISDQLPWKNAIGSSPTWIWKLVNQQGYLDAYQYEFSKNLERTAIIQLVVIASEINILELK